ncbi:MAG: hypothetical protein NVSMB43_20660 [Pseudarthrobacter sp.]
MPSPSGPRALSDTKATAAPARPAANFAAIGSPYLGIMLAFMAVVLILSNIGASKGVVIGPIVTDGGFFLFPLAYILGDVISEVYGFKVARKAIFTTFALSVFASICYWVIIALPGFDDEFGASKQAAPERGLGPGSADCVGLAARLPGRADHQLLDPGEDEGPHRREVPVGAADGFLGRG